MKKVLVFALVLSLVLGSFSFAFAASFSDTEGLDCEGAVNVLTELGVVNGYPDGTYNPEGIVTRAEMAKLLIVALGMEDYVKGAYSAFPDVPGSHWATAYISYATSLGIIEGYPDGTFKPDATVTYQEAVTMIVRALGYQDQYLTGVWPASHVNMALNQGILDDIVATADGANRGDVAIMIYNALTCGMITYDSLGNANERNDFMAARLGAYPVVDANGDLLPVVITATDVCDAVIDIEEYLGVRATIWVNEDDEILVVKEVKSTTLVGEFDGLASTDVTFTTEDDVEYGVRDDDITGARTTKTAIDFPVLIQNASDVDETVLNVTDGAIYTIAAKVSGKYIETVYSVQEWKAADTIQIAESDLEDIDEDLQLSGDDFILDDNDEISQLQIFGADSLDALAVDNVVTTYLAASNKTIYEDGAMGDIIRIEVGTETVSGKITKINSKQDSFTIDGTAYSGVRNDGKQYANGVAPALGDEGTWYLDYNGDLAFYDADDYAGNYAVTMDKFHANDSYGGSSIYETWLMTKDGDDAVYAFKDKTTSAASINIKNNIVEIETNADGKITAMRDKALANATTLTSKGVMNGKLISDEAVVFICIGDTDDWYVGELDELKTGSDFTANSGVQFGTNADGKVDVIHVTTDVNVKTVSDFGFFTSYNTTYDADDTPIYDGTMLKDGASVDFATDTRTGFDGIVDDYATLYVLTYDGDAITSAAAVNLATDDAIDADFASGVDGILFKSTTTTPSATHTLAGAAAAFGDFYRVMAKDSNNGIRIDLGAAGSQDYQMITDANVYKVVLKSDGVTFNKFSVGSESDVRVDSYVILLQLDEDSDNWDTVLVVTRADAAAGSDLNWTPAK